jgi:hypothetical protein
VFGELIAALQLRDDVLAGISVQDRPVQLRFSILTEARGVVVSMYVYVVSTSVQYAKHSIQNW